MDIGSRWGIALLLACSATKTVLADDMYRPREREAYPPDVYCRWNRTGLPFKQQEICAERDRRYGVYEHKWQKLVSVNGAVYLVDLNSVVHNPDTSYLLVYEKQGEEYYDPRHARGIIFNCATHYYVEASAGTVPIYVEPNSIAAQIESIACTHQVPSGAGLR